MGTTASTTGAATVTAVAVPCRKHIGFEKCGDKFIGLCLRRNEYWVPRSTNFLNLLEEKMTCSEMRRRSRRVD